MQTQANEPQAPTIYGEGSSTSAAPVEDKTFRQRLVELFGATDFVKVKNIDDEVLWWQYLPATKETHSFSGSTVPMKETSRGIPEQYSIAPGETKILMGENAYMMLEVLYKKMAAKKVIRENPNVPKTQVRNFNFTDSGKQEIFIKQAYLGKTDPFAQQKVESYNDDNQGQSEPSPEDKPAPGTGFNYEPRKSPKAEA